MRMSRPIIGKSNFTIEPARYVSLCSCQKLVGSCGLCSEQRFTLSCVLVVSSHCISAGNLLEEEESWWSIIDFNISVFSDHDKSIHHWPVTSTTLFSAVLHSGPKTFCFPPKSIWQHQSFERLPQNCLCCNCAGEAFTLQRTTALNTNHEVAEWSNMELIAYLMGSTTANNPSVSQKN